MDSNLSKDDPYRGMNTAEKEIKPEFLKRGKNSEDEDGGRDEARETLGAAETGATEELKQDGQDGGGMESIREGEEEGRGFYAGAGKKNGKKKKGIFKGKIGRKGPIGAILLIVFGVGGMMAGSQLMQPFAIVAQFVERFGSMEVSANARSNVFLRMQMNGTVKNPVKGTLFGKDTFKITNHQAGLLAQQGIEYDDDFDGHGTRVLKFDDGTGEIRIVAADEAAAARLTEMDLSRFNTDDVKYNTEAVSFKKLYAENTDFFHGYNKGSMTWRGAIANWFGGVTLKFLSNNKLTRNLFNDYRKKLADAEAGNTKTVALEMMAERAENIEDNGIKTDELYDDYEDEVPKIDESGNQHGVETIIRTEDVNGNRTFDNPAVEDNDEYYKGKTSSPTKTTIKRSEITLQSVSDKLGKIGGKVQKGVNVACTLTNLMGAVTLLVTASEALQIINLTTSYFETVDKVKAGYGNDAPIHELTSALNERKENTHVTIGSDGNSGAPTSTKKTAMESEGLAALFERRRASAYDPSVESFNFSGSIKRVFGGIGVSMGMFEACSVAKIAANMVTAFSSGVEVAACILGVVGSAFTLGLSVGGCGPLIAGAISSAAWSVAIGALITTAVSMITPFVANVMTRDLITNIGGEDLGNALTAGGNMYLGNTHRANGGSLATKEKYITYAMEQQRVVAEKARDERAELSPFDMSSNYTFLGTLVGSLKGLFSMSTVMSAVTSGGAAVSNAIVALSPTAMAYGFVEALPDEAEYEEMCPYLASIGAVGDAYCNPYAISDISTVEVDPVDIIDYLDDLNSFESSTTSDGNVKINGKSDLAKYILYCDNRTSGFGIVDNNILSEVSSWGSVQTGSSKFNNVANSVIGAVPVLGDVIDMGSSQQALNNAGYISGESCVAGNTVSNLSSPDWEVGKFYQRFIEDQSLAESMGLIEESAVSVFLDEYYKENPLDNSYEGILARYSGLEKEDVVAILDIVEYYNYIANYDPSERYAFGESVVELEEDKPMFDQEEVLAGEVILPERILYADVRNRSFVV